MFFVACGANLRRASGLPLDKLRKSHPAPKVRVQAASNTGNSPMELWIFFGRLDGRGGRLCGRPRWLRRASPHRPRQWSHLPNSTKHHKQHHTRVVHRQHDYLVQFQVNHRTGRQKQRRHRRLSAIVQRQSYTLQQPNITGATEAPAGVQQSAKGVKPCDSDRDVKVDGTQAVESSHNGKQMRNSIHGLFIAKLATSFNSEPTIEPADSEGAAE